MKSIKKLFAAVLLALALGTPGYACGDMSTPPCMCGDMSTPPCRSGMAADPETGNADPTTLATEATDVAESSSITKAAIDMFLMALTLY